MELSDLIYTFSAKMQELYGEKVFRIGLSTGVTCPNRINGGCIFCNPESFRGTYQIRSPEILEQLEEGIKIMKRNTGARIFLAYFQDETSTAGDLKLLKEMFSTTLAHPDIVGLVLSTRPDFVNVSVLKMLKSLSKPVSLELGLQSIHRKSLAFLRRGHSQMDTESALGLCSDMGIASGVHLITGIPGENLDDMQKTINWVSSQRVIKEIKFHNLVIYRGTALADLWEKGEVKQMPIDEHIEILSELIPYVRKDIVISRLFTSNILHNDLNVEKLQGNKTKWMNELRLKLIKKNYRQGIFCPESGNDEISAKYSVRKNN